MGCSEAGRGNTFRRELFRRGWGWAAVILAASLLGGASAPSVLAKEVPRKKPTMIAAPKWSLKALKYIRKRNVMLLSEPVAVAGVRSARARPEELYWKGRPDIAGLLERAGKAEEEGKYDAAERLYGEAVLAGARGRELLRARIGLAVEAFRRGEFEKAEPVLKRVLARATDPALRFAAGMPLAIVLAARGEKDAARTLINELVRDYPDHPLAVDADSLLLVLE